MDYNKTAYYLNEIVLQVQQTEAIGTTKKTWQK